MRAGLGEAATDEVGPGDDGDVEPRLTCDELVAAAVPTCDQRRADENRGDDPDHAPELGGLERRHGLGSKTAGAIEHAAFSAPAHGSCGTSFHAYSLWFGLGTGMPLASGRDPATRA